MNAAKAILLCAAAACAVTAAETDGTAAAGNAERAILAGIVRNALADGFASNRADRCRAVVLDAKTGEILADESIGGDEAWLEARFEIGTLAVPFLAAAALDAGVVQTNTALDVAGPDVEGIPLADHPGFSGTITMDEAVAFSSNRGSARLALALGPERAARALEAFGFRVARSFDGETDEKRTFGTVRLAVGHFVLGNATEIAGAISAFANGGTPVEARTAGVGPVAPKAPAVSADACGTVREFLRKTVRDGTGTRAAVPGLDVAGKTGTIPIPDDRRYTQRHRSMFAGFFDAGTCAGVQVHIFIVSFLVGGNDSVQAHGIIEACFNMTGAVGSSPVEIRYLLCKGLYSAFKIRSHRSCKNPELILGCGLYSYNGRRSKHKRS